MDSTIVIPRRMAGLPRDRHGRPAPWFVAWIGGEPDHRVVAPGKVQDAVRFGCCWLCGEPLGANRAFVIGPMCAITRTTSEPPSHRECAVYAARACPFLTTPRMVRRPNRLPDGYTEPPGVMLKRNPGVALVCVTRSYLPERHPGHGYLFRLDLAAPTAALWFAQGREATRAEAIESLDSGMPLLREVAEAEGEWAVRDLEDARADVQRFLPQPAPQQEGTRHA
ncbi:hypothetical protein [Spongiactinospora sp. TRM90649]|uniref:hypothetical protein n=1 Tax=Spongiactinospora sp. TRM90649 TaxID=3031114 RepID=UPI0023F7AA6E|nr:hypothetical protein [Spongiactinospora sp. TRM90649]MDF5758588.1 hypothetical protein [Spongiactinospora sp. TRM90649]